MKKKRGKKEKKENGQKKEKKKKNKRLNIFSNQIKSTFCFFKPHTKTYVFTAVVTSATLLVPK